MDRRQKKSREAIFGAFGRLLERKKYEQITVQDIIDEADVGRSTFYAHFDTKDALLKQMCDDIFNHIFTTDAACGYPESGDDMCAKLSHILWHLREHQREITAILSGAGGDLFSEYLRAYMDKLFSAYVPDFPPALPRDFVADHLSGSFLCALRWWIGEDMRTSPETTASYFVAMLTSNVTRM